MRPQEHGRGPVRVLVHPDRGFDEVGPEPARWDLQALPIPRRRVVFANDALLHDAQNLPPHFRFIRHKRGAFLQRLNRELPVVLRPIGLAELARIIHQAIGFWAMSGT